MVILTAGPGMYWVDAAGKDGKGGRYMRGPIVLSQEPDVLLPTMDDARLTEKGERIMDDSLPAVLIVGIGKGPECRAYKRA